MSYENWNISEQDKINPYQLLEERNRYYSLFQNSPFGLVYFDNETNVIDCNLAFLKIFNLSKNLTVGVKLTEKLQDSKLLDTLKSMFRTGFAQYEDNYVSVVNGEKIPVKIVFKIIIENDKPPGGLAIVVDMSEKYKFMKKLDQSENKYKTIFDSLNDAVIIHDLETKTIIECNDKASEMFQFSKEELVNKTFVQLSENISPFTYKELSGYIEKADTTGPQIFNWRAIRKDSSLFWIEVNLRITALDNTKCILTVLRDISDKLAQSELKDSLYKELENKANLLSELNAELKNTEDKLITLNENKDKFYSTISHDLKSPFLSILGYTEFLDKNLEKLTRVEIKDSLVSLNLAISNVYSLIERLLEWSRTQSGEFYFHPIHLKLAETFDNNIEILIKNANYKNIRIINEIAPDVKVTADEYMLSSVIRNLVGNAIKYSYMNSKIIISSKRDGAKEIIMIKDFSAGIDAEIMPKLFSMKFHIAKEGTKGETGYGLGLLLCKEWIEKNNGKLWLESEKNIGTTSFFSLPVSVINND